MSRTARVLAAALVAALSLAGCTASDRPSTSTTAPVTSASTSEVPQATGDITVFAAASLTETFTELGKQFEAANPGAKVTFNFAGSSALAQQINQGAPVDVFASAAPANMKQVTDAGGITATPTTFVRNKLQIAVPKGNPGKVTGLADFGKDELKIALCAEAVPCGAAAKKALEAAGVTAKPDTLEQDVKAALTKVKLGEVDAALVYATDVKSTKGEVEGIDFPEADKAINDYPIAPLAKAPNAAGAQAFVDFVLSDKGRAVLTAAGFAKP
ncbi:molybdate ABC transporter substrate-binding protein [Actinosynnema sp. NPDC020468]|uniref:molybdate ABC transporter substrate-binding protein n=1 Tax=Actinosynnema sp. NPDC020468 TaxID=3154488 RepID=UPI0033D4EC0A